MSRRIAASLLLAASLTSPVEGALPASQRLTDRDFQRLMKAAVEVSARPSDVQSTTIKVCVQQELDPPLKSSKALRQTMPNWAPLPFGIAALDKAFSAAMSSAAGVAQKGMPRLAPRFILIPKARQPIDCPINHGVPLPGQQSDDSTVVLSFTRPALESGYAFIEEYEDCPGLCGTNFVRAFRKQNGRWTEVGRIILSVS